MSGYLRTIPLGPVAGTRLTVLKLKRENGETKAHCLCQCSADKQTKFWTHANSVKRGLTKSCGCLQREERAQRAKKRRREKLEPFAKELMYNLPLPPLSGGTFSEWKERVITILEGIPRV